jgi:hypothetical protein
MYEIMEYGKVKDKMKVYKDLFMYRSGVYKNAGNGKTP